MVIRPSDEGGGRTARIFFSVLRASFWSKTRGGGGGPPGPSPGSAIAAVNGGGGGGRCPKFFFSVLRASLWSKHKGGPSPPGCLPWIRRCCNPCFEAILFLKCLYCCHCLHPLCVILGIRRCQHDLSAEILMLLFPEKFPFKD